MIDDYEDETVPAHQIPNFIDILAEFQKAWQKDGDLTLVLSRIRELAETAMAVEMPLFIFF